MYAYRYLCIWNVIAYAVGWWEDYKKVFSKVMYYPDMKKKRQYLIKKTILLANWEAHTLREEYIWCIFRSS